jgi:hypothetical protein
MGKQLEFTAQEQKTVTDAIMAINEILLLKMDDGVESPTLEGIMDVDNEDKKVVFSFVAQRK